MGEESLVARLRGRALRSFFYGLIGFVVVFGVDRYWAGKEMIDAISHTATAVIFGTIGHFVGAGSEWDRLLSRALSPSTKDETK